MEDSTSEATDPIGLGICPNNHPDVPLGCFIFGAWHGVSILHEGFGGAGYCI